MAEKMKEFTFVASGEFLGKLEELQLRTNIIITDVMSQEELLGEIFKLGIAEYEDGLAEMEKTIYEC